MNELDWGTITPESANLDKNVFLYVFNHKLSTPAEIDRTIRFIVGRLLFYDKHLPAGATHHIKIDARGQRVDQNHLTLACQKIKEMYGKPGISEIEIIDK